MLAQWAPWDKMLPLLCLAAAAAARSHPEEVRKFYKLVDEFHRMWDVVTEFDSLSNLATQMVPVSAPGGRAVGWAQCCTKPAALQLLRRACASGSVRTVRSSACMVRARGLCCSQWCSCSAAGLPQAPHECAGPCCEPHSGQRHRHPGELSACG
jgi:hypothetical protein